MNVNFVRLKVNICDYLFKLRIQLHTLLYHLGPIPTYQEVLAGTLLESEIQGKNSYNLSNTLMDSI